MNQQEAAQFVQLLQRTSPFACLQTNPSLVLDQQNNWGRSEKVHEAEAEMLVKVQLPIMAYAVLSVRAVEIDNGTNPTQLYPYALIEYGNGNVLQKNVIDATGGWQVTEVGSTFHITVFLADADMMSPVSGSGASAKFEAWACVGVLTFPQRNTQFSVSTSTAPAAIVTGCDGQPIQGRMTSIKGFVAGAGSAPSYLLVFDSNIAPGQPGFGSPEILDVFPIASTTIQDIAYQYPNTVRFINGLAVGISSSPTAYVAQTSTEVRVMVETLRDG